VNDREISDGDPCPQCGASDLSVSAEELTIGRLDKRKTHAASCACGWRGVVLRDRSTPQPAPDVK